MKKINRKSFIRKSAVGIAGISLGRTLTNLSIANANETSEKTRALGNTGIKVSALGMGATRTMEPAVIKAALKVGINFFDTGRAYVNGRNEQMLGEVLKEVRKEVVIQSKMKVELHDFSTPESIQEAMDKSLHESLAALQTDYIDIMLLHGMRDVETISNETVMKTIAGYKQSGKIRAMGFSSHSGMVELIQHNNKTRFYDVVMCPFNPFGSYTHSINKKYNEWDQEALLEALIESDNLGVGFVAMKTTSGGPYAFDSDAEPSYASALKWILQHDFVDTMAVAMDSIGKISENLKCYH